ncbi:protein unc-79 homolog [Ciona intestinalis]
MSTREEYFSKKLVYLQDCYSRLQWSSGNAPTVSDISAAIKYFNKALLSIMKEVTESQKDLISVTNTTYSINSYICFNKVNYSYPCLDYFTFFNTVVSMMGKLPYLHSGHEDMSVMLMEGICLVTMFLEEKARATVPLTVAGLITELCWTTTYILIQEYIVKTLCNSILPCCLGLMTDNKNLKSCFDTLPAVISVVLDGVQNVSLHFRVIETIMLFKQDVWLDLMSVISYGGCRGKAYAVQLLFHYWPFLHSAPTEHTTPSQYSCSMVPCTNLQCKSPPNNNAATLLILDQSLSTKFANSPPPLYLCYACSQTIGHKSEVLPSLEVMLPTENISFNCENKHCLSNDPTATVILCSSQKKYLNAHNEKAVKHFSYTWNRLENRATRYCDECFCNLRNVLQHLNLITQVSPMCVWETDSTTMQTVINAIGSLLIETSGQTSAKYFDDESASSIKLSKISFRDANATTTQLPFNDANYVYPCVACCENIGGQNDLLGQFGVWLLVLLCPPKENICEKLAMQLISTILCWYGTTSCLKSGEFGSRLESLKPKYLHPWLEKMCELYSDVVVAILSPNPSQNSRVKGYWDSIQPLWKHYEDTLTLIICLSSYSIIRLDMWKRLMPLWLAALNDNIPSADLIQLKPVLTTLLDPQLSPLSFDAQDMFGFIFNRFNQHTLLAYEDSLEWLQVLTETEVFLPLEILGSVFCDVKLVCDENQFAESAHSLHALNGDYSFKEMKEDMTKVCKLESIFESMNIVCNNPCSGRDLKDMFSSSANNDGKRSGMWISFPTAKIVKSPSFVKSRRSSSRCQRFTRLDLDIKTQEANSPLSSTSDKMLNFTHTLICYVDMLDVVYQQILLQEYASHETFKTNNPSLYESLLLLLTKLVFHTLNGKVSLNPPYSQTLIDAMSELFQLYFLLLSYILPEEESDWPSKPIEDQLKPTKISELSVDSFDHFSISVKLFYGMIKVLNEPTDPHTTYHLIRCISVLCLKANLLVNISEIEDDVMREFEYRLFFPCIWKYVDLGHTDTTKLLVPVLLRASVHLKLGLLSLLELLDVSYVQTEAAQHVDGLPWVPQFTTINRIQAILMCIDDVIINLRSSITYIVTYSIILLFSAFDETNTAVSVKAKMVFETLSVASLQVIYECMEHEFDESVKDRQILLTTFLRLHLVRPNTKAISFSFFSKRMDILSAEAAYYKKLGQNFPFPVGACSQKTLLNNDRLSTKVKQVHRNLHSSLPIINRLASRNGTQKSDDTSANELTLFEEQLNYNTVHQLIYAMCRYMIDCKKEEITSSKFFRVFLHQFQSIFRYSEHMSYFTCTPTVLRSCIGLSTFLLNLPLILDHNMNLGNIILPMVLSLLEHVTSSSGSSTKDMELEPRSLNFLLDSCKSSWLLCIQIILYKYEVSESVQRNQLQRLMRVCLNTLESEFHGCTTDCLKIEAYSNEGDAKLRINTVSSQTVNTRKTVGDLADNEDQTFYSSSPPAYKDLDSNDSFNVNHSLSSAHQTNISDTVMKSFANLNHWNEALASGLHCNLDSNKTKQSKTNSRFDQGEATSRKVDELSQEKRKRENVSLISVRCIHCKENITESNKDTISICIVNLCQFVRFDASLAVPSIPRILAQASKVAEPLWDENPISTTGSSAFESSAHMAKQSIRCILHQLAENHIFSRLFLVSFQSGDHFIPVLMTCLRGYSGLHHVDVLRYVLEGLPDDLSELNSTVLSRLLTNLATYLQYLPHDAPNNQWQPVVNSFALFFLKMQSYLQKFEMKSFDNLLNIMIALLNAHAYVTLKQSLLEPFSKVLTMLIPSSHFSVVTFHELCTTTNKIFNKDRDKLFITRLAIVKLIASLKLSCSISECNLLLLLQFVLLDSGSSVNPHTMFHFISMKVLSKSKGPSYAMECMKGHLSDCLDILSDEQFLTKIADKLNNHTNCCTLDMSCTDSGRSHIKLAIAQIVAGMLCQKTLNSSFPWLFQPPSTMQYGLKEYNDCVTHIKRLSWILLGTLSHLGLQQFPERTLWQPVPFETGPNLSNILQVIFAGYLEHNKARHSSNEQETKISMGALFYSFLFCQLWTVYCEQLSFYLPSQASSGVTGSVCIGNSYNPINEHATPAILLLEFWSRVTPSILVLLEQDGPISKNGHRHIASLIECLRKYDSSILFKLQPMWTPLLNLQPLVKKWSADELRAYHNFNSACSSSDDKQKNHSKLNWHFKYIVSTVVV